MSINFIYLISKKNFVSNCLKKFAFKFELNICSFIKTLFL